jgi:hypothetical protein
MFELLERSEPREGWITVRCAVNGKLAIPFQVHRSDIEQYRTEKEFLDFCERQGSTLISQFGDAREQRVEPQEAQNGSTA